MKISLEWTSDISIQLMFISQWQKALRKERKNHPPFVDSDYKMYHLIRSDHILDHVNSCVSRIVQLPSISLVSQQLLYWAEEQRCVRFELRASHTDGQREKKSRVAQLIHVSCCFCSPLLKFAIDPPIRAENARHDGLSFSGDCIWQKRGMCRFTKRAVKFVFSLKQRLWAALSSPDQCWVKCCITSRRFYAQQSF